MPAFMVKLRALGTATAKALEFQILTGARPGEVINLTWDQIELDLWTIPSELYKTGIELSVPLKRSSHSLSAQAGQEQGMAQAPLDQRSEPHQQAGLHRGEEGHGPRYAVEPPLLVRC